MLSGGTTLGGDLGMDLFLKDEREFLGLGRGDGEEEEEDALHRKDAEAHGKVVGPAGFAHRGSTGAGGFVAAPPETEAN